MASLRSVGRVPSEVVSIHRILRKSGERFVVRYRDADDVNRSRAFRTRAAAEGFHQHVAEARTRRRQHELVAGLERF